MESIGRIPLESTSTRAHGWRLIKLWTDMPARLPERSAGGGGAELAAVKI